MNVEEEPKEITKEVEEITSVFKELIDKESIMRKTKCPARKWKALSFFRYIKLPYPYLKKIGTW